jgi:4'-phosphopantetheinyl transferase EntD
MKKLLTPEERLRVGTLSTDNMTIESETLLRFSFKESIYKALHPFLLRPISFQEVEIDPCANGTALVTFKLVTPEKFTYKAEWIKFSDKFWITCVCLEKY